jgi:hypothetical protein
VDVGDTSRWLAQGAIDDVRAHREDVAVRVQENDIDLLAADDHLLDAGDELAGESYQATVITLISAYFRLEHADAPFIVLDPQEAAQAAGRLGREFSAYLEIEHAGGQGIMAEVQAEQQIILDQNLFNNALNNPDQALANVAFLDLLVRLVELSDLLQSAQDGDNVWVRNWQWPVGLQVRVMAGVALELAAAALGDDFEDPQDSLLAETKLLYDAGIGLIDDRLVDEALVIYVDNRCVIFEVYNHSDFEPAGVPPEDWECAECVLTGDCADGDE